MVPNEINVTYSMYDRLIFGGAVPATKELVLETCLLYTSTPAIPRKSTATMQQLVATTVSRR